MTVKPDQRELLVLRLVVGKKPIDNLLDFGLPFNEAFFIAKRLIRIGALSQSQTGELQVTPFGNQLLEQPAAAGAREHADQLHNARTSPQDFPYVPKL